MFPHDAPCHGQSHVMYPGNPDDPHRYNPALALCAQCPYHDECRAVWEDLGDPLAQRWGVWFGTTPGTRSRRPRRCLDCPTIIQPTASKGRAPARCPSCRARHNANRPRLPRPADPKVERNRQAKARQRANRLTQGLCVECGRHLHRAGRTTCIHCAQAAAVARDRRRRAEQGGAA